MADAVPEIALTGPMRLLQMLHGKIIAQAICAAAELKVADHIGDRPESCETLAGRTRTDPSSLYRLLRLLSSLGIFVESPPRAFAHTADSHFLKSNVPGSVQAIARMVGAEWHATAETRILHSLRSGEAAFVATHGMGVFDYLTRHDDAARVFNEAMTGLSDATDRAVLGGFDFSACSRVVDVGGGRGNLIAAILRTKPHLSGVLFDMQSAIREARTLVQQEELQDRCELVEGSFFDSVPTGGDLYLLKYILHDWDDVAAVKILERCRRAMTKSSKLLVIEDLISPPNVLSPAKITDLEMLVIFGGRERTTLEYSALLEAAGFKLGSVVPAPPVFLLEALPL